MGHLTNQRWYIEPYSDLDKHIDVSGPLSFTVDFDDVNPTEVEVLLDKVVKTLNGAWDPYE